MAFRKLVGSYKDYNLSTHIIEAGYLAVDVDTGSLRIGDGVTPGGSAVAGGGSSSSLGDLTAIGSTLSAPSNADLTLTSSGGNVVIEGIRVAGTTISTEDSSPGIEIAGNLIPSQNGVFQLGSQSRRWQTAYLSAETLDIGGATILFTSFISLILSNGISFRSLERWSEASASRTKRTGIGTGLGAT